jgi:hypothetical protein
MAIRGSDWPTGATSSRFTSLNCCLTRIEELEAREEMLCQQSRWELLVEDCACEGKLHSVGVEKEQAGWSRNRTVSLVQRYARLSLKPRFKRGAKSYENTKTTIWKSTSYVANPYLNPQLFYIKDGDYYIIKLSYCVLKLDAWLWSYIRIGQNMIFAPRPSIFGPNLAIYICLYNHASKVKA